MKKIVLDKKKENLIRLAISKKNYPKKNFNKKKVILLINEIKEKLIKKNYNYLLIKNLLISDKNIRSLIKIGIYLILVPFFMLLK